MNSTKISTTSAGCPVLKAILGAVCLALMFLSARSAGAAEWKNLSGHIPKAVTELNLQPVDRLAATTNLYLTIGLPRRDQQGFNNRLQQLYDPASTNFHHYLSPQQITETFGPTKEDYQSLIDFVTTNGLKVVGTFGNRMVLDVVGNVSDIERAFHLTMRTYQHPTEARLFYAPDVEPTVNAKLPILDISGLDNYTLPHTALHRMPENATAAPASGTAPSGNFWGADFRNAYAPGVTLKGTGQMVGLVEGEGFYATDIYAYESSNSLPSVSLNVVLLDSFTGNPNSNDTNGVAEASLDIELVIAMAPGLATLVIFEGNSCNDILSAMVSSNQIKQLSSSWSFGPFNSTSDNLFQMMALQGQSFFFASGDGDAWVGSFGDWSSDDPNVISVGGTQLFMNGQGTSYSSESVWNWGNEGSCKGWCCNPSPCGDTYWGSGGGVSTRYTIPSWQQGVGTQANGGSSAYRNVPDVAMTADNIWVIYEDGLFGSYGGTSCAAPLWAAFTALVNQQAIASGHSTVGFLNPVLYAIGQGPGYTSCFHDITTGNNESSNSPSQFLAITGYDLTTGWGSPNGSALINALVSLDGAVWVDFNYTNSTQNGTATQPYKTLSQGASAVAAGGTVAIKTAGSSSETLTINKAMTIRAVGGTATVGR